MTEVEIIKVLARRLDNRKYLYQIPNAFIYGWECDYWACTKDGVTKEFEIKTSRSDYFNDAKKDKHQIDNGANYFYYVVPKDLVKPEEVDKKYGLIYVWETGYMEIVKKPRSLNNGRFENWKMLANKMYWRYREMWKKKYIAKEITVDEYQQGFNIELEKEDYELMQPCPNAPILTNQL